jgi:4-azaleucine resistance transporter AzlC
MRLGMPIFLGYVPVGTAFGIIATSIGFSALQALACSATALAGAGQFIALSVMRTGEGAAAVLAATTVVNLRYVLFAATMSPYLRGMTLPGQAALAFTLTDETFAVNIADRRSGLATGWSQIGVGLIAWTGWLTGTAVGALASSWIGDPASWGVDFAMPAMFVSLLIALAEDRTHALSALLAGSIALTLPALASLGIEISSAWFIVIASIGAATTSALIFPEGRGRT